MKTFLYRYWHNNEWHVFTLRAESEEDARAALGLLPTAILYGTLEIDGPTKLSLWGHLKFWFTSKLATKSERL